MKIFTTLLLVFFIMAGCHFPDHKKNETENAPATTTISPTVISIKTACILSELSYCSNPDPWLAQYLPGWKIAWKPQAVHGNYAFVATDGSIYAIAIRGSLLEFSEAALNNWLYNDLNVASQQDWNFADSASHARISAGSYIGWENMNQLTDSASGKKLWDFLQTIPADAPIVLTGHSLGGNLATVYASYLWWQWKKAGHPRMHMNVITFAAPAAGNEAFAESFDAAFPNSLRIENSNDIVPKFPVAKKITALGDLYSPGPAASSIAIGYKNLTVDLPRVFSLMSGALQLLRITNEVSPYVQTNGDGTIITIPMSGKNNSNDAGSWFAEAGYQHGMLQYAKAFDAPLIDCSNQ
jgi:PBP1b-binding outer membrane lipoprotein LpoB